MALSATIHKAQLQIADMDRNLYADHQITLARHPSETDERMMIRLLAFALNVPTESQHGELTLAKDLWDVEEAALWHKDYTNAIQHWIDVGQPDEKRVLRACGRSRRVSVYSFAHNTPVWWKNNASKLRRANNLVVWQIDSTASQALGKLAQRNMKLQVTVQDGTVWLSHANETASEATNEIIELTPRQLITPP